MLKNGFYQRKKLKYKNNKTFYQKFAGLRLLQGRSNLKKNFFLLGPKMTTYECFYTST